MGDRRRAKVIEQSKKAAQESGRLDQDIQLEEAMKNDPEIAQLYQDNVAMLRAE